MLLRRGVSRSVKRIVSDFMPLCEKRLQPAEMPTKVAIEALIDTLAKKAPLPGSSSKAPVWQLTDHGHKILKAALEERGRRMSVHGEGGGSAVSSPV